MTDVATKAALAEFVKDVERVEQLLDLIGVFRDFAGQGTADAGNAHKLWVAAQGVRTDLPVLSGSLLLYLCGRFEYFVRELVGTVVDDLVDKANRYEELPDALRKEYLTRGLAINQNPGRFNHTVTSASLLAAELAENLTGKGSLRIDSRVITITESNMNSETLIDIFRRVGIVKVWETLGKQLPLKKFLNEANDDSCKKAAMARLDDIMSERNKVAHPTAATVFPDVSAVQEIAQYFRILAQILVDFAAVSN